MKSTLSGARLVAQEQWRYWIRSQLVVAGAALTVLLLLTSTLVTSLRVDAERQERETLQTTSEATFKAQPARHPHRMVHYGHYVFRPPPPLAPIDPGVDRVTGTVMFLEGHRQNTAAFPPAHNDARTSALASLTPAQVYRVVVPLLLVLAAYACFTREREDGTDLTVLAAGITPTTWWAGKALALCIACAALLLPLAAASTLAVAQGESLLLAAFFFAGYAAYLLLWAFVGLTISSLAKHSSAALVLSVSLWASVTLVLPPLLASVVNVVHPLPSRLEENLDLAREVRALGDGHNPNDPAFRQLRASLLEEYGVDEIEQLPINFRGAVAVAGEKDLTALMNRYAGRRFDQEQAQAGLLGLLSVTSPAVALGQFSRASAGTDLTTHHRFLRTGEEARYTLVQQLNALQMHELTYADDTSRSRDADAERRTRVDASHWRQLDDFRFAPDGAAARMGRASGPLLILIAWWLLASVAGLSSVRSRYG